MDKTHSLTLRLTHAQYRALEYLERKLSVDKTNLIRLSISRLAEAEGFFTMTTKENRDPERPRPETTKPGRAF
jgi:hypothetical protein